ncbi:MAG: hypothetical protein F4X66_10450 [Chloroflexi bacterium]|nr:hypothetical protein [Chloroflexota bacterium]MYE39496.1 hypothetical protein [Chloroflexota bacterium]
MVQAETDAGGIRLNLARELLQAARDEFGRAEEAKGGAAVIGLRNSCGKGWLATVEAINAHFLNQGVAVSELPDKERGRRFFVSRYMSREMRRNYNDLWKTFHVDGYYGGIVEFDEMPERFDELEEFIEAIALPEG